MKKRNLLKLIGLGAGVGAAVFGVCNAIKKLNKEEDLTDSFFNDDENLTDEDLYGDLETYKEDEYEEDNKVVIDFTKDLSNDKNVDKEEVQDVEDVEISNTNEETQEEVKDILKKERKVKSKSKKTEDK